VIAIPVYNPIEPGLHVISGSSEQFQHQNHYDFGSYKEKIYLCTFNSTGSFYFKSGQNYLKLELTNEDDVKFQPLTDIKEINTYYKDGEYCVSSASAGWGMFIYDRDTVDTKKLKEQIEKLTKENQSD